ncbi:multiheme c-type cytochrome [candidate division KSB1 bacterium]
MQRYTLINLLPVLFFLIFIPFSFAQEVENNCVDCHIDLDDELGFPAVQKENDIHFKRGIMCVDCHGGNSRIDPEGDQDIAMDPANGYVGKVDREKLPQFCDRCHGDPLYMRNFNPNLRVDQYQRYKTSVHGQLLSEGDEKVAICSDCHSIHGMRSVKDPASKVYPLNVENTCGECHANTEYMETYGIAVDQNELYSRSVHYEYLHEQGDMFAPTCNDCHGNHGAAPPGAENIHFVCGQCHISNKELFDQSTHSELFKDMELPECVICHSNHEILRTGEHMLSEDTGVCWDCHDTDSDEGRTIISMTQEIEGLKRQHFIADSLISLAGIKGMEVQSLKMDLIDVSSSITKARNLIHTLSTAAIKDEVKSGNEIAGNIKEGGITALNEIYIRRIGLFVALLFIMILGFGIYFKIRKLPDY